MSFIFLFSHFLSTSRNIPATASSHFLKNCTFDNKTEEGQTCPIFSLGQIVGMINGTEGFYDYLATEARCMHYSLIHVFCWRTHSYMFREPLLHYELLGTVIWTAILRTAYQNILQEGWTTQFLMCPLGTTLGKIKVDISSVLYIYLFLAPLHRYPRYHYVGDVQYRDLVKAYGILFVIQVTGQVSLNGANTTNMHVCNSFVGLLLLIHQSCPQIRIYDCSTGSCK